MSRRLKIALIVLIGLIIIALILWFFWRGSEDQPEQIVDETAPVEKVESPSEARVAQFEPPTETEKMAASGKTVAQMFVERFGTYTNHSNFDSIKELTVLMTGSMKSWVEQTYLPSLNEAHDPNGFFYRITARAPVVQVLEQSATAMKVQVSAQREEKIGDNEPIEFLQDIILDLVKEDQTWLVDAAYWQEKR